MKLKKEYFFIAIAIVLLVGYLSVRKTDRTEYRLPAIAKVAASDITRIEIARQDGTVVLEKKDTKWRIQPQGYPADSGKVNAMLDDLEKLSLTALVSESKSYSRYDLEPDKAIHVKAWAGEELKRDIQIGKPAPTFQHTFVRVGDAPEVYHAQQNLKTAFDQTADKLRDKTVLAFSLEEVKEIAITKEGKQTVIRKSEIAPPPAAPAPAPAEGAAACRCSGSQAGRSPVADGSGKARGSVQNEPAAFHAFPSVLRIIPGGEKHIRSFQSDQQHRHQGKERLHPDPLRQNRKGCHRIIRLHLRKPASVFTLSDRQAEPLIADPETLTGNAENPEKKN